MRIPKYRKHSRRDFAFVEIDGKRIRLPGAFGSFESKVAYADLCKSLREIEREKRRPVAPPPEALAPVAKEQVTIMELSLRWLDFAAKHYPSDDPNRGEYSNVKVVLDKLMARSGSLPACEFGPVALKAFRQELIDEGLRRKYINGCISKVKRVFRWGASEELIDISVYQALTTVIGLEAGRTEAKESPKKQFIDEDNVRLVIAHCGPVIAAMVELQWLTGARSGSIVEAKPEQFDRTCQPWIWRPKHKNEFRGQDLMIPVGPRAQEILRPFLNATPEGEYLFNPRAARKNPRYRKKYTSLTYRQAVLRAQEEAGVSPGWSPHHLRHARATIVRKQFGLEAAQAVLGHMSLDATQIYASSRFDLAKTIASELG